MRGLSSSDGRTLQPWRSNLSSLIITWLTPWKVFQLSSLHNLISAESPCLGDPANTLIQREVPAIDPGSRLSFKKGREWLQKCRESHLVCREQYARILPTRLLQLPKADEEVTSFRLVEAKTGDQYAALTYCWGGDQDCKLTMERLSKGTAFQATDLPPTIMYAIQVARNLGLSFLWVDSLCIVQDDDVNKDIEIDKMADIHGNATVTISAANSVSCREGIFKSRRVEQLNSRWFKLPFRVPGKGMGNLFLATSSKACRRGHSGDDPIEYRAWTLQEHALSPRILYYSYYHLYWLCRETKYADGGLGPRDHSSLGFHEGRLQHYTMSKNTGKIDPNIPPYGFNLQDVLWMERNPNRKWQTKWEFLLSEYQHRRLTDPGDRLVAISAIGSQFAAHMNTEFVAGLFSENLAVGMLWLIAGQALPRPQSYRAPSWSWAAIDSPTSVRVCERGMRDYPTMQILTWNVRSISPHTKFGRIESAYLKAQCWVTRAKLQNNKQQRVLVVAGRYSFDVTSGVLDALDPELDTRPKVDVYLLEIWYPPQDVALAFYRSCNVVGLLVVKQKGDEVYKRVGWFNINIAVLRKLLTLHHEGNTQQRRRQRRKVHRAMRSRWRVITLV